MNYPIRPASPSQSFLQKPNEEGCQLDWLDKVSGPLFTEHANMSSQEGGAKHHLELHHPSPYFLSTIRHAGFSDPHVGAKFPALLGRPIRQNLKANVALQAEDLATSDIE